MISLIIIALFFFTAVGIMIATRGNMYLKKQEHHYGDPDFNVRWLLTPVIVAVLGLLIGLIQPYSIERIDAGNVGVKVNLTGHNRGASDITYETGWVIYNSWFYTLHEFPTFQQHIEYADQQVILKGGFSTTIKPTFNYSLKADAVVDMFKELRLDIKNIEQGWLKTAIISSVNDVGNKWNVDEIFNNREKFESAIIEECNKRVNKWFVVSQLRTNIVPPPALKESIESKTKAVQEAQAEQQKALVAKAQADVRIATARGDSAQAVISAAGRAEAMRIEAKGQADAIRMKQSELSTLYVEFMRVQQWNGAYPTHVFGGAGTPLISIK